MGTRLRTVKVGDKVKCVDSANAYGLITAGHEYTVSGVDLLAGTILVNNRSSPWSIDRFVPVQYQPITPPLAPLSQQVGGDHYRSMKIQPMEYILANNLPFPEGCVVKYVSRWRKKGGLEDLKKARQNLDFLIEAVERGDVE